MKVRIKHIDILSSFKIGAVLSALLFLVGGVPVFLIQALALGVGSFASSSSGSAPEFDAGLVAGLGLVGVCLGLGVFAGVYALAGGISAAIGAFVYNLTSGWIGGVEVDLETIGDVAVTTKAKTRPQPQRTDEDNDELEAFEL